MNTAFGPGSYMTLIAPAAFVLAGAFVYYAIRCEIAFRLWRKRMRQFGWIASRSDWKEIQGNKRLSG